MSRLFVWYLEIILEPPTNFFIVCFLKLIYCCGWSGFSRLLMLIDLWSSSMYARIGYSRVKSIVYLRSLIWSYPSNYASKFFYCQLDFSIVVCPMILYAWLKAGGSKYSNFLSIPATVKIMSLNSVPGQISIVPNINLFLSVMVAAKQSFLLTK